MGTTDLPRVGDDGAEWDLEGGNGFKDALFRTLRGFLEGEWVKLWSWQEQGIANLSLLAFKEILAAFKTTR